MEKNNKYTFHEWVEKQYDHLCSELKYGAADFLAVQSETDFSISDLKLDSRWHYLNKLKTCGYIGELIRDNNNVPFLKLTFNNFKSGGEAVSFNNKEIIRALWQQEKEGRALSFKPKYTRTSKITPSIKSHAVNEYLIQKEIKSFESLALTGESPYLTRKQLTIKEEIKGIRFAKNHIAVLIVDTQLNPCGLQKIYNDGAKRFTKGLNKKGHFALIGAHSMPIKPETIYIAEGLATAATIHLATMSVVFTALDALNILPVAKELRSKYPKAQIVFWADNDYHTADKLKSNGDKIGNTGLIHANYAALKVRNSLVMTPDFKSLSNWDEIKDVKLSDFNDLNKIAGVNALLNTIPKKPDLSLALELKLKKQIKRNNAELSPRKFNKSNKETFNERYLPKTLEIKEGVSLIRSPIGTGKTQAIENLLKKESNLSVLFTTHLISLVESGAGRLGLTSYNHCDAFDLQMEKKLAICLNSLGKLVTEGPIPSYDVLVIDEVEQVLTRLTNNLPNKPLIFAVLKSLIENASYIVCLDAHLSASTVSLIKSWAPNKEVNIVTNNYQVGKDKAIKLYDDKESLQVTALNELRENKNIYLTFNSKNEASKTFSMIKEILPTKKGLYISGDNTGDKANLDFFSDVNKFSKLYDYIICTPSVSTGVSISNNHFDFIAGIFNANINTSFDCMQALGRVRDAKLKHVFCEQRRGNKPLDSKIIAAKWNETHQHDLNLMNINDVGDKILLNDDYELLAIQTTQKKNSSANNFYEQFALLALEDGYELNYATFALDKEEKKHIRDTKTRCSNEVSCNALENIELLSETEIEKLGNKPRKTLNETLSFERHKLIDFYKLNHNDEISLKCMHEIDSNGRLRKKINLIELALSNKDEAKRLFEAQYKEQSLFRADVHNYATEQMLYKKVLEEFKITYIDKELVVSKEAYDKKTLLEGKLIPWIKNNYNILSGIISLPPYNQLTSEPLRFVSKLLDKVGLKQKRVGKNENSKYLIESEQVAFVSSILAKRNSIKGDSSSNNCLYNAATVLEKLLPSRLTKNSNKEPILYSSLLNRTKELVKNSFNKLKNEHALSFNS